MESARKKLQSNRRLTGSSLRLIIYTHCDCTLCMLIWMVPIPCSRAQLRWSWADLTWRRHQPRPVGTLVTRGHGALDLDTRHGALDTTRDTMQRLHPMSHSRAGSRVSPARRLSSCPRPRPPLAKCYKTLTDFKANLSYQHYQ